MIIDSEFSRIIALDLLKINAVILRPNAPFKWSSGWNSPIYCDNRLTMRYPKVRKKIARKFVECIDEQYPEVDVITGTATAGIPHAAWIAENMDKPMAYVRAKAKSYGMGNQIEGVVQKGESTIVVEDLISTGGSAISVVEALRFISADIKAVFSIFTYGFDKSIERFQKMEVPLFTLTDYETLIDVASEYGYVSSSDLKTLSKWRQNPETWPK